MRPWLLVLSVLLISGCSRPGGDSSAPVGGNAPQTEAAPSDPIAALHDQLRSGAFQIDAAMGSIEKALALLRPTLAGKPPETKEAIQNVIDALDSAGATVADFQEAPEATAVKADFAANDDLRIKAIKETNDAARELRDAEGTLKDLVDSGPPPDVLEVMSRAQDTLSEAREGLEGAIEAFGGKVEAPVEEPAGNDGP